MVDFGGLCSADMYPIDALIEPRYLFWYMLSIPFIDQVTSDDNRLAMPKVNQEQLSAVAVPVPPLAEQHRIVKRVDELMALLDRLETARAARETTRAAARDSALAALRDADTVEDAEAAWERIAERMHDLFTDPADVEPLRQAVLQLAVRGRLVPQDPSDEPATALLDRVSPDASDRKRARATKRQTGDLREHPPFALPPTWSWASFVRTAHIASNLVQPAQYPEQPHVAPDSIEKGTGRLLAYRTIGEDGVTSSKHRFFPGQILYSKIRPNLSKVVAVDFGGLCSADMYPIDARIDTRYLFWCMLSKAFLDQVVSDDNRLAMPKVNQEQLATVAVPPLAEQHRIVAKVDELMALLDRLEARLAATRAAQDAFAAAAVHHFDADADTSAPSDRPAPPAPSPVPTPRTKGRGSGARSKKTAPDQLRLPD